MNSDRITQILEIAKNKRLAVIGDVMLDRFIYGRVSRISPEAPVPVVEVSRETSYPGGAANVARNLRPFCREVQICGSIGADVYGVELRDLLKLERIETQCLLENNAVLTTVKTRVIARQQQVVRVDREKCERLSPAFQRRLVDTVLARVDQIDALIFQDYGKGLLSQELVTELLKAFVAAGKVVTVDPNPNNVIDWSGATAIKPNRIEAFSAAGLPDRQWDVEPLKDETLLEVGSILLKKWRTECLLMTLGENGMMLFSRNGKPYHTPTRAKEVFDVSGAGDTAIALFTLALCSGASPEEAAEISNHASGIVVGKLGTATLDPEELVQSFRDE